MPGEGFITIHEAQPQGRASTPGGNRPYPPHQAPVSHGNHPAARIINANPPLAGGQQYQARPVAVAAAAPPLLPAAPAAPAAPQPQQQYAGPYVPQPNTAVKIQDIRRERPPTAEEAREALSEYRVIRFQKITDGGGYGSDGERRKHSWKRAMRIEVPGLSKHEVARIVRDLNRDTLPVAKKKAELTADEQRQIELALEDLQKSDNAWFQTILVQLDAQVRPKEKGKGKERRGREKKKDHKSSRHRKEYRGIFLERRPPSKHPKSKETKELATERVSLTAYYKRSLRPNVDPIAVLQYLNAQQGAQIRRGMQQSYAQQAYAQPAIRAEGGQHPVQSQLAVSQNMPPPHNIPPPRPGANYAAGGPSPAGHGQGHGQGQHVQGRGPPVTIVQPSTPRPTAIRTGADHRHDSPRRHSPRPHSPGPPSTDESVYSETFSIIDDDMSITSPSSASYLSNRGSYERLGPRKRAGGTRYAESPAHFGIKPNPSSQAHPVQIQTHGPSQRRPALHDRRHSFPHSHSPSRSRIPPTSTPAATSGIFIPTAAATNTAPAIPIPPSPAALLQPATATTTTIPALDARAQQIYSTAYAAGRADMAERIAAAAVSKQPPPPPPPPGLQSRARSPSPVIPRVQGHGHGYSDRDWEREQGRERERLPRGVRSGVRIVRPGPGPGEHYVRPRVDATREGMVERGMERLRVGSDDELDGAEYDWEDGGYERERYYRGLPGEGKGRRAWERERGRSRDRDREYRAGRTRPEESEYFRRRDSGVDVGGLAFGDSNPFTPRPGLARRSGTARYTGPAAGRYDDFD
ncbi:hypothetical protein VTK56DRAFT_3404 [Thermocarpiscus australiensis]